MLKYRMATLNRRVLNIMMEMRFGSASQRFVVKQENSGTRRNQP